MKKILLVFPYSSDRTTNTAKTPPLGLGYIASFLEEQGHIVSVVDMQIDPEEVMWKLLDEHEIIGFSTFTPYFPYTTGLVKKIRDKGWNGKIILGGPHASAVPEECCEIEGVDYVCNGEGEELMVKLARGDDPSSIAGLHYKIDGKVCGNPAATYEINLDDYPRPSFHLFKLDRYTSSQPMLLPPKAKNGVIFTSRGCPYSCNFCFKDVFGKSLRVRGAKNVVDEIEYLNKKLGYHYISILDDVFNVSIKHAKEVCKLIIERNLNVNLLFPNGLRADHFDEEFAKMLNKISVSIIAFGLETGNQNILDKINKNMKIDEVYKAVELCKKYKLPTNIFMIIGHKWDTEETILDTIRVAQDIDPTYCQFTLATPIPGSQFFKDAISENRLLVDNYEGFDHYSERAIYDHPYVSPERMAYFLKYANRSFYFRLSKIWTILSNPWIVLNMVRNLRRSLSMFMST